MDGELTLRSAVADDDAFQYALYASTRAEELALTGWSDAQKEEFTRMQFAAQTSHYRIHYPDAVWNIILHDGVRAGRLIVDRREGEIGIIDISLVPEFRGRGIGTRMLRNLFGRAWEERRIVSIHVEKFNPARRLYDRLGFRLVEDKGVYLLLHWEPGDPVT